MATRERSQSRSRSSTSNRSSSNGRSAFNWNIAGAMVGGAALAVGANMARKFLAQTPIMTTHWADSLIEEHDVILGIFDDILATDESQSGKRKGLLVKLAHALDRHAYAEEHVIYPALRQANDKLDAEKLETEHGEVKEFLFRLKHLDASDPEWIGIVGEFRTAVEAHARMEEDEVFPRLRAEIDEPLDKKLTAELAAASYMMA